VVGMGLSAVITEALSQMAKTQFKTKAVKCLAGRGTFSGYSSRAFGWAPVIAARSSHLEARDLLTRR
jgi:hypothetical protein